MRALDHLFNDWVFRRFLQQIDFEWQRSKVADWTIFHKIAIFKKSFIEGTIFQADLNLLKNEDIKIERFNTPTTGLLHIPTLWMVSANTWLPLYFFSISGRGLLTLTCVLNDEEEGDLHRTWLPKKIKSIAETDIFSRKYKIFEKIENKSKISSNRNIFQIKNETHRGTALWLVASVTWLL
jgi:hypothetical protein